MEKKEKDKLLAVLDRIGKIEKELQAMKWLLQMIEIDE